MPENWDKLSSEAELEPKSLPHLGAHIALGQQENTHAEATTVNPRAPRTKKTAGYGNAQTLAHRQNTLPFSLCQTHRMQLQVPPWTSPSGCSSRSHLAWLQLDPELVVGPAQLGGEGAVCVVPAAHHVMGHRVKHSTVIVVVPAGRGETRDCPMRLQVLPREPQEPLGLVGI